MKLIKFMAAAALVASTFLVSGGNAASSVGVAQDIAACPNWPYCRDVEIVDQAAEVKQYIAACPNWPYCRDVEIADEAMALQQQVRTAVVLKAV